MKICPSRFVTQIEHRKDGTNTIIGFVADFKYGSPDHYKSYKYSYDGEQWSNEWLFYTEAVGRLLVRYGLDPLHRQANVLGHPQLYHKKWRPIGIIK